MPQSEPTDSVLGHIFPKSRPHNNFAYNCSAVVEKSVGRQSAPVRWCWWNRSARKSVRFAAFADDWFRFSEDKKCVYVERAVDPRTGFNGADSSPLRRDNERDYHYNLIIRSLNLMRREHETDGEHAGDRSGMWTRATTSEHLEQTDFTGKFQPASLNSSHIKFR